MFSLIALNVKAQRRTITGTVVDEKNVPLPGVTIKNQVSGAGTMTDAQGHFKIDAGANESLSFSFVGYTTQTRKPNADTQIMINLNPANSSLNEVVVIGYGTQDRDKVTSANDKVSAKDFRQSGARNPLDLIQGKVAGLNLTRTSGSNPNSGVSVQLRGAVTVTGSASPLYVVDGIPYPNSNILDVLQQDDIESIDVIKDGSGAAIYGTTANAGVILITTKKGQEGPPRFDYSTYFRKEYLQRRAKFLTPDEFRQRIASGDIKQQDFGSSTDFYDQLINHGNLSQNHNLALSGGTNKTLYRASINYRDLQGIAKENGRKEYNLRFSVQQTGLNDRLKMQLNVATNFNNANLLGGGGWESELTKNPTLSNYNPDGSYRFDLTSTNEFARLSQETSYRKQQTTTANAKADLTIVEGLKASVFGSVVRDSYLDGQYRLKASENSVENTDFPGGGYAYRGTSLYQDFAFEPTIQYEKTFKEKHDLTALVGYSYRYHIEEGASASNRGFINDLFHEDNLAQGSALALGKASMSSFKNDNTLVALLGRISYSYDDKYLAQFILRREGSSRFGDKNKFGYFPGVSGGWVVSREGFMKDVSAINFLKLRVGYGITGNSGFANNASRVTLGGGGRYLYPDGQYLETYGPNRNPNPDLKWETKRELNIGADFSLIGNRLSGKLELFKRTTKDLLDTYTSPQPPFIQSSIYTNVGTISSKGIELSLSYSAVKSKNFSWDVDATFSTLRNTLDSYSNDQYKVLYKTFGDIGGAGALGNAITTYEGGQLGEFWGKRFAGFTSDGKWLFYNRNGEAVTNDKINYSKDRNLTDLAKIGNAIPKYYASWNNDFRYKNWDLRVFLRGKFDFDILNTTALSYANKTWSGNLLRSTFTKYAAINDTYQYSDYYIESGSYVKLDEVTLGYNFKFKTKLVRNLRVYVSGQNLATITGYTGSDPDFIQDTGTGPGIDSRGAYPSTRTFLVGLNFGF
ncbi:SusC/RagA family TonB-linked outer membrane protein [Mucilaginibacter sp. KACC 22063]|uniref:SusC/RagA family TonB-linked outer membrane protein n=1 Tax=Mucilaginibacter sp. KACC 22063 TaxID=3025666 RepID=UPI00236586CA|nr:SusC/RagA family TonB-linked outer membrane protein [Mucilaginibacter sp. KACC 22063]WDF56716.1 SusC/RagA family TonB-linked outer membrane protein [Mucilaginibacter sp. KACC 22063]